jgi:hypothetical protein
MSQKQEISLSLRVTGPLASFVAAHGVDTLKSLGEVSTHSPSLVVVDIIRDSTEELEAAIDKGLSCAEKMRTLVSFPTSAEIALWVVVSSSKEFVGLVIPSETVQRAASLGACFVFSVYSNPAD